MIVKELITRLGFKVDKNALRNYDKGMRTIRRSALMASAAVFGIGAGVVFLAKKAGEMEQIKVAFETMLGSAEKAKEVMEDLTSFAAKTPFTITGVFKSSKQLLAMGIEVDKLLPTLKSLGDVSAGVSQPLARIALNFGQVKTQGKLTGRELRDFNVLGVGLASTLAKNMGVAEDSIQDLVSAGKVKFKDVEEAFASMTGAGGRFENLMIKQSKTLLGLWSNFQDTLQILSIQMGDELLPTLKSILLAFLDWHDANKKLIKTKLVKFVKDFVKAMKSMWWFMSKMVYPMIKSITSVVGGLKNAIVLLAGAISFLIGAHVMMAFLSVGRLFTTLAAKMLSLTGKLIIAKGLLYAEYIALAVALTFVLLVLGDIYGAFKGEESIFGKLAKDVMKVTSSVKELLKFLRFITGMPIVETDLVKHKPKSFFEKLGSTRSNWAEALNIQPQSALNAFSGKNRYPMSESVLQEDMLGDILGGKRSNTPLTAGGSVNNTTNITVYASPDNNNQDLANKISEQDRRERRNTSRNVKEGSY